MEKWTIEYRIFTVERVIKIIIQEFVSKVYLCNDPVYEWNSNTSSKEHTVKSRLIKMYPEMLHTIKKYGVIFNYY